MAKRKRIDSASEAVRIMQGATREMQPPSHVKLSDKDWPFWESVIAEFARAEWTEHQLELAAMLARNMADYEEQQRLLRGEGFTSESQRGTPVANPRVAVAKGLMGDITSMRRSLALHARAQSGDSRSDGKRKEMAKALENNVADDLLATPSIQ